ncbi:hypothetical protein WN944_027665 [Citrus x changshan-huyou]|uniref:Uncharacterized protein n=1 Tax=Citrus x changshan-huyou TaxID=2935761 RepID=A0AAP0LHY5_9ROSI
MSLFLLNCYRVQYRMAASTTTKGESYVKREEKLRKEVRAMQQHDDHKVVDEKRSFKLSCLGDDCKGILALSEAAYLLVEGESIICRDAINSTTTYLKEYVVKHNNNENNDGYLCTLVTHALELPLYWRMQRLETRWFTDVCKSRPSTKSFLLELAKLDFNIVQAAGQEDLKYVSKVRI